MPTVNQPTLAPTRKQTFVAIGAVCATMLAAIGSASGIPFFVKLLAYPGFEAALGGGIAFFFGWYAREHAPTVPAPRDPSKDVM